MSVIEWVLLVAVIVGLVSGGGLFALSGRVDLPFEVPRPAPYVVLSIAAILLVVLVVERVAS